MNTKNFQVGKEKHCFYCGKKIIPQLSSVDIYGTECEYQCQCSIAIQELFLRKEKSEIESLIFGLERKGIGDEERALILRSNEIERLRYRINILEKENKERANHYEEDI